MKHSPHLAYGNLASLVIHHLHLSRRVGRVLATRPVARQAPLRRLLAGRGRHLIKVRVQQGIRENDAVLWWRGRLRTALLFARPVGGGGALHLPVNAGLGEGGGRAPFVGGRVYVHVGGFEAGVCVESTAQDVVVGGREVCGSPLSTSQQVGIAVIGEIIQISKTHIYIQA